MWSLHYLHHYSPPLPITLIIFHLAMYGVMLNVPTQNRVVESEDDVYSHLLKDPDVGRRILPRSTLDTV